jgi:hypothetical protein
MPPSWAPRLLSDDNHRRQALAQMQSSGFQGLIRGQGELLIGGEVSQAFPYWAWELEPGNYRLERRSADAYMTNFVVVQTCTFGIPPRPIAELASMSTKVRISGSFPRIQFDFDRFRDFAVPATPNEPYTSVMVSFFAGAPGSSDRSGAGQAIARESFTSATLEYAQEDGVDTDYNDFVTAIRRL